MPSNLQFSPLSQFKHRVAIAASLPFNVYDADRTLLLARGQLVENYEQMCLLFERGALVDIAELADPAAEARRAKPHELPGLWNRNLHQLGETLRHAAGDEGFVNALDAATPTVLTLIERDRDLAIFQVLRQEGNAMAQYGITRSMHAAITALLVAQRLGWAADDAQRAFKAALTMNISMLELQGELARQSTPLSDEQRDAVRAHPDFSRLMLELSGVTDPEWLRAVAEHHEAPDGSGYPGGLRQISDTADLVRRADIYTAKLSPRGSRQAMAADVAGRQMFMQDPGHPMTAALVKEFGVYPPGCYVRLESGECGLVVRRGPTVTTPVVAVMSSPAGNKLSQPIRRDTSVKGHAIQSVISGQMMQSGISPEMLVMLAAG
ncbi:HD-GYP domain-containing protein [Aquabacterium sp. OR-4]|uniref:HD-GYP domain-containing protein n=1 Tax=Aquabacterium sp. OR-4 TaxID=2978127 RepID=UPI0028C823F3|nr:HD domain-containing phosphohydrolase [Aquabacterium sp. OR-4]MDT7836429.1 HD domain-containing phosphohydrolase [Aquabacterium sp. OR-4]